MRLYRLAILSLAVATLTVLGPSRPTLADSPQTPMSSLKPDVAALLKLSTDSYKKMKTYRHTVLFVRDAMDPSTGVAMNQKDRYTLALERPNRFVYKNDSHPTTAAVSDGKTFINFKTDARGTTPQYTRKPAPADFKGINIVDDVTFDPLATYLIALMLQGDPLADKDVRAALEKAKLEPGTVTENGKKWQVLTTVFDQQEMTEIYFNAEDHLIGKAVLRIPTEGAKAVETYENISVNKPIPATVFQYTPPAAAKKIDKFPPAPVIQKPDDARNTPRRNSRTVLTGLPSDRQATPRS